MKTFRIASSLLLLLILPAQATGRSLQFLDDEETVQQYAGRAQGTSNKEFPPLDDTTIRTAVHEWVTNTDKTAVIAEYGRIEDWDTSQVTSMSHLFTNARFFNEDIGGWNVSSVTDMTYMFAFCSSFNVNLELWDVSRVTSLRFAFHHASQFEGQGLAQWDVSRVRDLTYFAQGATQFKESLWRWHVNLVMSFNRAFHNATAFGEQLCWELHPQAVAIQPFCGTQGAFFSCDPHDALDSEINQQYYECCDCEYTPHDHHYWADDDANAAAEEQDQKLGVILASLIWAMVFIMLVLVIGITLRRRREVRQWLQSKLGSSSSSAIPELAPDGGAIATFVGPASSGSSGDIPHHVDTNIRMVVAGISTPQPRQQPTANAAWAEASYPQPTNYNTTNQPIVQDFAT